MSLILGIYSRNSELKGGFADALLNDFRRHGELKICKTGKFILAAFIKNTKQGDVFESGTNGLISAVSGEILDFRNVSKKLQDKGFEFQNTGSSAEFILNSFLSGGENFLSGIRGSFTLNIYDPHNDELIIANDRYGIYPLFVYYNDDYFIFSNEFEPILKYHGFDFKPDEESLAEYFLLGAPLGGKTFFKSVMNLKPATILKVKGNSCTENTYHANKIIINKKKNLNEFAEDFALAFRHAVQTRTEDPENLSCALSGGIDTRLILSAIPEVQRKKMRFITLLTEPLSESEDRDVLIAKMITSRAGLIHMIEPMSHWSPVWTKDFDISYFNDLRFRSNDYILSGHYGSELVKGEFMSVIPAVLKDKILTGENLSFNKFFHKIKPTSPSPLIYYPDIFTERFIKKTTEIHRNLFTELENTECENKNLWFAIQYMTRSFFSNMYRGSFGSWLMTYRFPTVWSLPFLDAEILDILLSMPLKNLVRRDQKFYNTIYKNHFREFIDIPTSSYFGEIEGNCIPFYGSGKEPKNENNPRYANVFKSLLKDSATMEMNIIDISKIKKYGDSGDHPDVRPFIEFEIWYKSLVKG